jgi:cell wall-associated NlpC family hydrolase
MADTPISGANEALGSGPLWNPSEAATGPDDGTLDTPIMPLTTAGSDEFQKALAQGSTLPGGFSNVMAGGDQATGTRESLVKYAKQFLGTPYVWGGSHPGGFDCSGLVQYVTKKFGLNLPRISNAQANSGTRTSIQNLQAGDLVAWDENKRNNGADHIAFYIGNGYVLEAPHTGANVRIRKIGKNEGAYGVHLNYPG